METFDCTQRPSSNPKHPTSLHQKLFINIFTGGFYQDQMGQVDCKRCSIGTFVPEKDRPGTSAGDCRACPYGKECVVFQPRSQLPPVS